jgi:hypothetical protein
MRTKTNRPDPGTSSKTRIRSVPMERKAASRRTTGSNSLMFLTLAVAAACGSTGGGTVANGTGNGSGASASSQSGSATGGSESAGSPASTGGESSGLPGGTGSGGTSGAPGTTMPSSGTSGASSGAEAGSTATEAGEPDIACDPADKTPDATPVMFAKPSEGAGLSTPTGMFKPVMESDPGIPTHTIIRPDPLGAIKHPIIAWGEGGCAKSGNEGMFSNLFMEFASHGALVIADGPATASGPTMAGTDAKPLLFAIDWAIKENERPCSKYYHKLNVNKVGVSGQSCGGLMAEDAAVDPRITTAFPYDSGLFSRDQTLYDALHAPMAIFDGGSQDIAYANGLADFMAITKVPMLFGNPTMCTSNAHVCTFFAANAGEFGRAGVAWINWWLLDDLGPTGKGMFIGNNCGLCDTTKWTLQWNAMKPM